MSTKKELYKQSETIVIKRSQINFAPYNPKKHTKELVNEIKKNIKRVAFLGGIVWNEKTTNLIDGHKRIMSLDIIHKYDGTSGTDYDVKVEKIDLDEKTEKEQNIFQTESRTELEQELMQSLLSEIDYKNAGLKLEDLNYYLPNLDVYETPEYNGIKDDFKELERKTEEEKEIERQQKKQQIKEAKNNTKLKIEGEADGDSYVVLSFNDFETKSYFMELIRANPIDKYVKGENVISQIKQ